MTSQKKDPSKQNHRTPTEFLAAVAQRFGAPTFDLAATDGEQIEGVAGHFSPAVDSLAQSWDLDGNAAVWLNPPFQNIRPWVRKCDRECRDLQRWTLVLVPASMGSLWWRDHVLGKCMAIGVVRMTFRGSQVSYPKDLALLAYGYGVHGVGFWDWRNND